MDAFNATAAAVAAPVKKRVVLKKATVVPEAATAAAVPATAVPEPKKATIKKATVAPVQAAAVQAAAVQAPTQRSPREALQDRARGLNMKGDLRVFYDKKGNLDVRTKAGKYVDHVVMPTYRSITEEELAMAEQERIGRVEEAEAKIEALLPELRELIIRYRAFKAGGAASAMEEPIALSDILLLNQQLDDAYKMYTSGLYAERDIQKEERLQIRNIHYDDLKNEKAAGTVYRIRTRGLPFTESLVRAAPPLPEEELSAEVKEEVARSIPGEKYTIFSDPSENNGFLSPEAPVNFTWNGTEYISIRQAVEAERARAMGNAGLVQSILKAPTSASVRSITLRASSQKKGAAAAAASLNISEEILTDIVRASLAENEERARLLEGTGGSTLVYADPNDRVLGVGRDAHHAERSMWEGTNLYGKALESVRQENFAGKQEQLAAIAEETPEELASAAVATTSMRAKTVGGIIAGKKLVARRTPGAY